jgi:hypothetical protein
MGDWEFLWKEIWKAWRAGHGTERFMPGALGANPIT